MNIREATEKWVGEMNAYPTEMLGTLYSYEPDEWREVTPPAVGDRAYVWDLPDYTTTHYGIIEKYIPEENTYKIRFEDETTAELSTEEFDVEIEEAFPAWGTMWAFDSGFDKDWIVNNLQAMADCGFRIYESDKFGYFFGIDGAGYDFYESHWIPLYKARGLHWHIED